MSHQGLEGWFPECLVCGCGNLEAIVCLDPTCHECVVGKLIPVGADSPLRFEGGHYWKDCYFCNHGILSDPRSFGTFALCSDCWNISARDNQLPPLTPRGLRHET